MNNNNYSIELDIADAVMEKPIAFSIGTKHFYLYPPTLGKIYLVSRLIDGLNIDDKKLSINPYLESYRICKEHKEVVCRILSYHSFKKKAEIQDERKIYARQSFFQSNLNEEELSQLLIVATSWDDSSKYIKHFGLDKDAQLRKRISELKDNSNNISFGGNSVYGSIIDFACQRYGWTLDYVVWGISYINLKMLMADAITSVYLSDEERKKLHIPKDRTFINADDPENMKKIMAMNWD